MAVNYKRLFHMLIDRDVTGVQHTAGYSADIATRLKNNAYVSLPSLEKMCRVLDCSLNDICETVPDHKPVSLRRKARDKASEVQTARC